jgi:hypothetical protein
MRVKFLTAAVLAARFRDRLGISVGALFGLVALALAVVGTVAAAGALSLAPAVNYGAHSGPFDVAAGDLNRDGKPDLVVANVVSADVSVLLGKGDGSFQAAINSNAPVLPISVAVSDLNLDGKLDLAVVNNGPDGKVLVLLGNGDGSFRPPVGYLADCDPRDVAVRDLNGDGKPDLVVASGPHLFDCPTGDVSVLLGKGDGTFQTAVTYGAHQGARAVVVGDLNLDGQLDLAVANAGSDDVSVLLGNGDGSLQTAVNYGAHNSPFDVAMGDLNGDGKPDLALADSFDGVSVLLGNGDGSFRTAVKYAATNGAASIALGDLNSDGKPDLALTDQRNIAVMLGNGDGSFQSAVSYAAHDLPTALVVHDLNGDNKADIAVANELSDDVSVLLNTPPTVLYTFLGFGSPISKSMWQAGRTIPVKFEVGDANGLPLPDSKAQSIAVSCRAKVSLTGPDPSTTTVLGPICASHTTANRFMAILNTSPTLSAGTYHVVAQIYDTGQPPGMSMTGSEAIAIKH